VALEVAEVLFDRAGVRIVQSGDVGVEALSEGVGVCRRLWRRHSLELETAAAFLGSPPALVAAGVD
jgi:hypothetical protein